MHSKAVHHVDNDVKASAASQPQPKSTKASGVHSECNEELYLNIDNH